MQIDYQALDLSEILDMLAAKTLRYNEILVGGGPNDEFKLLKQSIILLQKELQRRKESDKKTVPQ